MKESIFSLRLAYVDSVMLCSIFLEMSLDFATLTSVKKVRNLQHENLPIQDINFPTKIPNLPIWVQECITCMVKYIQFSPRYRKSHVKQQIQYELTCFNPFPATRCLHVANDFKVYSQLSPLICRLSAYTLWR